VSLEDTVTQKEGINELGHIETYPKYFWLTESSTLTHSVVKVASDLQNWSCNWPTIVALKLLLQPTQEEMCYWLLDLELH
jgi:hypothetical protein